ncbi:MAG: hypothetical protein FWD98_05520 [Defluviitaleaceae bacterium]|nr:hypothetical protein [Defluviitaleaceae bacterium]
MLVLSSERALEGKMKSVLMELGQKGDKVRVLCRCESMEDAEDKARQAGIGGRWFVPECCEEVREEDRLNLLGALRDADMAVCVDGNNFLAIDSDVRDMLLR